MIKLNIRRAALVWALAVLTPWAWAADADAFFRAIKQDNDLTLRGMLAEGFDPNTRNGAGASGLTLALQDGALRAANALLASPRLIPEERNAADENPLMIASLKGYQEIVQRLIEKDADVNKPGWTPLHYAATNGHLKIMELLLEHHAYIDAQSPNGTTPLMMAASYGSPEAVKLLIESGADIHVRNQKGMTALDFAQRAERANAVELLQTALRWDHQKRGGPRGKW
jgi:ankyrin repeat protein